MNLNSEERIAVFGTDEQPATEEKVVAGKLSVRIADGQIASVAWDETEILRGVAYLLRDANWATPTALSTTTIREAAADRFSVEIRSEIRSGAIRFDYGMRIEGDAGGNLRIATRGTALSAFRANRIGLTVLHPLECAGSGLVVTHTDGSAEMTQFPALISPSQPVFDIGKLTYRLARGESVDIAFMSKLPGGKAQCFEMEDQRNWGDASYKTYVGSLLDPWPFDVAEDDVFEQTIGITLDPASGVGAPARVEAGPPGGQAFCLPPIGLSLPLGGAAEALHDIRSHGMFRPAFVSAYLRSDAIDGAELAAIGEVVRTLDCPLSIELEVDGEPAAALGSVADALDRAGLDVGSVLACPEPYLHSYQPDAKWPDVMPLDAFYGLVRESFPKARVGGGMLSYFTELNRKWPPAEAIDFVAHAYCPIVHAADDETVVQNIDTLAHIALSVDGQLPGVPYEIIAPQLSMRQNPYGAAPQDNPENRRLAMANSDPREDGQFGGLWLVEIARVLARTHVRRVSLGALSGSASIFSPQHPGGKRPSYYAAETLCRLEGADEQAFLSARQALVEEHFGLAEAVFRAIRG